MAFAVRIEPVAASPHSLCCNLLQLRQHLSIKTSALANSVQIGIELLIGKFICPLVFAIVLGLFLHSVVGQMYKGVKILESKVCRRSADIPLLVPIALEQPVHTSDQHIMSDIEFPAFVE
jgi:hypothetical protein